MAVAGVVHLNARLSGRRANLRVLVVPDLNQDMLLSWQDCISLGIISESFPLPVNLGQVHSTSPDRGSTPSDDSQASQIKQEILQEFPNTVQDSLSPFPINSGKMHITLKDGPITPYRASVTRQIPLRYQDDAQAKVEKLIKLGIIKEVTEPTAWCSHAFFLKKDTGGVRLVTDFTHLNKYVERPVHPFPSTKDILQSIPADATCFATLDAVSGYFQVELDEESSYLTTFLLPSGRYRYLRLPMGMSSSSDDWCRISDAVIKGFPWARKIVDDILISARSFSQLHQRIRQVLLRCRDINLIVSKSKFQIGTSVKFAGHIISKDGIEPDPGMLSAIQDFPRPANITEVRSFLGLANQIASFLPDLAHSTTHLKKLTSPKNVFRWLDTHEAEFILTKKLLTSRPVLKPFSKNAETVVLTDASRLHGLGFALMQRTDKDQALRLVMCGSKSLTPTQQRYATIELEALAIVYACQKSDYYLRGLPSFLVKTDHRPLVGIFQKPLHQIDNARLLRMREKLVDYQFNVEWSPGKTHHIADALSRAPVFDGADHELTTPSPFHCFASSSITKLSTSADHDYTMLMANILNHNVIPDNSFTRPYLKLVHRLSIDRDTRLIMLDTNRIVVPVPARPDVLRSLHSAHQGYNKTCKLATQLYYWPGMTTDIQNLIDSCSSCQALRPSHQKLPVKLTPISEMAPMSHVATDLYQLGSEYYLILVDRFSGFVCSEKMRSTTAAAIIRQLQAWFNLLGWPKVCRSDGGPQYLSEFERFCSSHGIKHETSSPYNAPSNGLAESAVKNAKYLLKKCKERSEDYQLALANFRNTPRTDGYSPAQLLIGRRQKVDLPVADVHLQPLDPLEIEAATRARDAENQRLQLSINKRTKELDALHPGDRVIIQNPINKRWASNGKVVRPTDDERLSYVIQEESGNTIIRGRRYLKTVPSPRITRSRNQQPAVVEAQVEDQEASSPQASSSPSGSPAAPLSPPGTTPRLVEDTFRLYYSDSEE